MTDTPTSNVQAKITAIANALTADPTPVTIGIYHDVDSTGYVEDDNHWVLADLEDILTQLSNTFPPYPYGYTEDPYPSA